MNLYESKTYLEDLRTAFEQIVDAEKLQGKTILMTGATGTIGSFVADTLLEAALKGSIQTHVILAGRDPKRIAQRFSRYSGKEFLECVAYSLEGPIGFEREIDYVIHAAGNAHPAAFNADPVGTIMGNVDSTYRLLEYAKTHGAKRFVFVSSGEVYGIGDLSIPAFEETYSGPLDQMSPRSCYPTSKRTVETLCAAYTKQYGLDTLIVRPCHTYGPGITESDSRAHVQFIRNVLNGQDIEMKSAGTQVRSYNYAGDCASGLITVLLNGCAGEAYNLANKEATVSIAGLAKMIAEKAGKQVVFTDPNALDIANRTPFANQVLDTKKLEALGWNGCYTVQKGIAHILQILQEGRE